VWISCFFREEVLKEGNGEEQQAHCNSNENQGSYCTSKGRVAHPQHPRKFLAADYHIYPSLPHLRTDIPLSSADCDDSEEEDGDVGTFERVAQLRGNGAQGKNGYCSKGASDQTDPEGTVRRKSCETWDTEDLEESVSGVEET